MITIFTTAKPFVGQMKVNQINALKSWKASSPDVEILLFGAGEGYAEVAEELGIVHIPEVETSEQGTPLYNSMFALARARGRYPVQAFITCDNILLDDFLPAIQRITMDRFLMVGQRWDIDLYRVIGFENPAWAQQLRHEVQQRGTLHPPAGSDYFVCRGSIWEKMPPVVVGRAGDDNALIYLCRASHVPVIDASDAVTVVHQNHDYGHHSQGKDGVLYGAEARLNRNAYSELPFALTPIDADWRLSSKGLARNYCRGDWERYLQVSHLLHRGTALGKLSGAVVTLARTARRAKSRVSRAFRTGRTR